MHEVIVVSTKLLANVKQYGRNHTVREHFIVIPYGLAVLLKENM